MLFPIAGTSTKAVRHPVDHCSIPLPIQDGGLDTGIRHAVWRPLCMVCRNIRTLWRPGVSATVLVDSLINPIGIWGEYANSVMAWSAYPLSFPCPRWWGLGSYSLLEWSVSAMSSLQMITDVRVRGLIKPHKWKCPILCQFMKVK